ncbi:Por secretion system C-terminal sorting domain-containing protein [Spirosomataceae bacterium TFI 002]|nr:Por secretion system C-terminal sorting domain-containing protein [Spirosomataceae bacterium TFI 002]
MKNSLLTLSLVLLTFYSFGQNLYESRDKLNVYKAKQEVVKGTPVICPANHSDVNTYVEMAEDVKLAIQAKRQLRPSGVKKAEFIVDYVDFPANAEASFQRAIDIWAEILSSDVPIRVIALWQELGPNTLGSAFPGDFRRNFSGSKKPFTWYPIALAEKMAGTELNSPLDYDMVVRFSSDVNWYYGATGTPAVGQFDLTTVVLHELCHGLGFVGSLEVEGAQGSFGSGTPYPFIFDTFVENDVNQSVVDTVLFKNPSTQLRNQLISENLFFNSVNSLKANGGQRPRLYAPTIFDAGSSISHLDSKSFPAGTPNSLMTPSAGFREVNNDPGTIVRNMFNDMGWKGSSVLHTPLKDFEDATEVKILAKVLSDTTYKDSNVKLHYLELDLETATNDDIITDNALTFPMVKTSAGNYEYNIPITDPTAAFFYWITLDDDFGKQATSPPNAPDLYWLFFVGIPDEAGPTIDYTAPTIVPAGNPISFLASVDDDYQVGIDTVFVSYKINGGTEQKFGLKKYDVNTDNPDFSQGTLDAISYLAEGGLPALSAGDVVTFRMTARDKAGNETIIPTTSGGTLLDDPVVLSDYTMAATSLLEPIERNVYDFNSSSEDFALLGFDVGVPNGLQNGALHTTAPYTNGLGLYDPVSGDTYLDFSANQIALLRNPIVVRGDTSIISFDEIVLVEPGEDGSVYGDQDFWDYVIVECSFDGGGSWIELGDGYDSGADADWKKLFTDNLAPANAENPTSNGTPSPAFYRPREIDIYDYLVAGVAGREMLLRFRLFSDQWVNGYGWVIDNLAIQQAKPKPLANEADKDLALRIGPNPTSDFIDIKLESVQGAKVDLQVIDIKGGISLQKEVKTVNNTLDHRLQVNQLNAGTYVLKVRTESGTKTGKFVVL